MGTALQLHPHQSLRLLLSSSFSYITSNLNNHRSCCYLQLPHQNVLLQQQPMKYQTLKSNPLRFRFRFRFRFSQPKLFCALNISINNNNNNNNSALLKDTMADNSQSANGNSKILNDKNEEEEEKKLEKSTPKYIPPPPEKPLPDDCCGSGCVRCVWDVYYEELEAYNKLYKTASPDSSDASGASKQS